MATVFSLQNIIIYPLRNKKKKHNHLQYILSKNKSHNTIITWKRKTKIIKIVGH